MRVFVRAGVVGLVFIGSFIGCASAETTYQNPQVEIAYLLPQKREYLSIYNRLMERRVLEELKQFLAPLRLPKTLTIQVAQCGAHNRPYAGNGVATICYELVEQIEQVAASLSPESRASVIAGAFVQSAMYQVAQAILDLLQFPVWGRLGDAGDRLSAFVMQHFGEELAIRTITATTTFFSATKKTWTGSAFADTESPEEQRFYNYLCIAYGGSPMSFRFLVTKVGNQEPVLPAARAQRCAKEYAQARQAFNLRIMPYIEPELLVWVRSREWLLPSDVK